MYAIFEAKGKQWRAEEGATLQLPSLDAEPGDRIEFDRVMLAERDGDVLVGRPVLQGASIGAEVVEHGKGEKIIVFKRKKRKGYRRKQGHRQKYTEVKILELDLADATAPAPAEVEETPAPEEEAPEAEGPEAPEEPEAEEEAAPAEAEAAEEPAAGEEIDVTGAAEELAEEHGVDLAAIEGTGKEGRILKSDVQDAVEALEEEEAEEAEDEAPEAAEEDEAAEEPAAEEEIDVTAAAEELAEEHGVDLAAIEGTGKDGRILKSDVQDAIDEREEA